MNYLLKRINNEHLNYFISIKQDDNVLQYLKNNTKYNKDEITKWFLNLINEKNTDRFVICDCDNITPIGDVCISEIEHINKSCSMHIKILCKYWNLKISSHVIQDIIFYCKHILKLKNINIEIHELNIKSINLFKKFNATFIKNFNKFNYYTIEL